MNKKGLMISSIILVVTIFSVVTYSLFNVLGITQSRVKRNELTITTESSEKIYDSLELSNDNWYIENGSLGDGDTLNVVMNTSLTNPDSIENEIGVTILDFEGNNVTIDYNIILHLGTLTVHPIELAIQTETKSKIYDGIVMDSGIWNIQSGQLFENDRIEYIMASNLTAPGVIDNIVGITILNELDEIVNYRYNIEYDFGTLTIYGIDITITTESYEKGYDGISLLGGSAVLRSGELAERSHIEFGLEASITIPGTIPNDVGVRILDDDGTDVTLLYNITYEIGTLTVHSIPITLRTNDESKVYDGEALINSDWEFLHGSIADTHTLNVNVDNQITNVGSIENSIYASIVDASGIDVSHFYEIEYIIGSLTVNKRELTIETESDRKVFDGTELSNDEWSIQSGLLLDSNHIEAVMTSKITEPGEVDNLISITILNDEDDIVTSNYDIQYITGSLTVEAVDLIISTGDFDKAYDGTPLLGGLVTIVSGQLIENHTIAFGAEASITIPGSIENVVDIVISDADGNIVTDSYNILDDYGTLTVAPITIILKTNNDNKVYDGEALINNEWEMVFGTVLDGHELVVDVDNQLTRAGSIENAIIAYVINDSGTDVSYLYNFEYNTGNLTVFRRDITISTDDYEQGYDGIALLGGMASLQVGSLADLDVMEYGAESSITNPGSIDNEMFVTILNDAGDYVTESYNIEYQFGTLTVEPIVIILKTNDETKVYDGEPLINNEWELLQGDLLENHNLIVDVDNSITNPGSLENEITAYVINESGNDVSNLYDFNFNTGTLTVEEIELLITTETYEKGYDGFPLMGGLATIQGGTIIPTNTVMFDPENSLTIPGTIDNEITITIFDEGGKNVTSSYNITYDYGTLTVDPIAIVFKTDDFSKEYDGEPLISSEWELLLGTLLDGHVLTVDAANSITNPGSIENSIQAYIVNGLGNDVSELYDIDYYPGTLTVAPINITISTDTYSKSFDGAALLGGAATLHSGNLLATNVIMYSPENSITMPGMVENEIDATILDSEGNNVTSSYNITYDYGTLTIAPIDITISTETYSKGYDGIALLGGTATLHSGSLLPTNTILYSPENSITTPGMIDNQINATILDSEGNSVTSSYNITYDYGTLTIEPITIVLKTDDDAKVYDGEPLISSAWEMLIGTLLAGDVLVVDAYNSITNPGSIENTIQAYVTNSSGNDVSELYDFIYNPGTLTIAPIDITISTGSFDKPYDGTALLGGVATLHSGVLLPTNTILYGLENSLTTPGSIENEIVVTILDAEGNNVTSSYNITYDYGTLTVDPISITLKTNDYSKDYDGVPLINTEWELFVGALLDGHELVVDADSQITIPGFIENSIQAYVINEFGTNVTDYYVIEYNPGTLTVNGIEITISTATLEKGYDGLPLLGGNATIESGALDGTDYIVYGSENSITSPSTMENVIGVTIFDIDGNDITVSYNITLNYGTLTVSPIIIILESDSDSKVYDGEPLSNSNWTLQNGTIGGTHLLVVDVDNVITDVGEIENTIFAYVVDAEGINVTEYYDIQYNPGTLSIFSSTYSSSQLATESFSGSSEDVFKILSPFTETIYFRGESKGNYTYNGWTAGNVQDTTITVNPLSYPGATLEETGLSSTLVQVEYLRGQIPFLVPYYTVDTFNGLDDVYISGDISIVNDFNIISFDYDPLNPPSIQDVPLSLEEMEYRSYVYSNYLDIPESTELEMLALAADNNLIAGSATIVADVKTYIRGAATYNLDFAPIPEGEDVAVYFLTVSKEGICQHYATAATLMYRALGVPARYVIGYIGNATAGEWATVTGDYAHAWVEVYMDGYGWTPVEVTGGGGTGGDTGGTGEADPEGLIEITVKPVKVREIYVLGKTISATSLSVLYYTDFYTNGYRVEATYGGELASVGIGISTVATITIFDIDDIDVTSEFDISYLDGELQMYEYNIVLETSGDIKIYDGYALTNSIWNLNGTLEDGHYVDSVTFTGEQTFVGSSKNKATMVILDADGLDVTSYYGVLTNFGDLTVNPKAITIESTSSTKSFDGTALVSNEYIVTEGSIADSDIIEISITGSQTGIGKSMNTIESIQIFNGTDLVTNNYTIEFIEGELIVTPPY